MDATTQILATKLYLPQPTTALVLRPRLFERLAAVLRTPLTIMVAPTGFGKTTLMSTWATSVVSSRAATAWLTLDVYDDDPSRFWAATIAALQTVYPAIGKDILPLLSARDYTSTEYVVTPLINQLAERGDQSVVLILDDYHVISAPAIHTALAFFIEHLPRHFHLVLMSRSDPPLPLALLRAHGQMTELRAAELRFTQDEAAGYLNEIMHLQLGPESVAALDQRTEGWIAGLHLAALSMQDRADRVGFVRSLSGSHHYIQDYLIEEVLQRQPEPIRDFLLHTAILDQLSAPLCDRVMGGADAATMLDYMDRANLFLVSLDDERRWYRYHHLFAEMLRARLAQERAALIPELHRRASDWYASHHGQETALMGEAVRHALAAGDGERAAQLVGTAAEILWARNEHATLLAWLAWIPRTVLHGHPRLVIMYVQLQLATGSLDDLLPLLDAAALVLVQSALPAHEQAALRGGIAAAQAHILLLNEQFEEAITLAKQALEFLPPTEGTSRALAALGLAMADHMRGALPVTDAVYRDAIELCETAGDRFFEITARCLHGTLLQERGNLAAAEAAFQHALQRAMVGAERLPIAGWALVGLGSIAYARHELRRADSLLTEGLDLARRGAVRDAIFHGSAGIVQLRLAQGNLHGARVVAAQFVADAQASRIAHFSRWARALLARVDLACADLPAAIQWARCARPRADALLYSDKAAFAVLIRVLIATGEASAARRCAAAQRALVAPFNHIETQVSLYVLDALALLAQGDAGAAQVALDSALAMAAPRGLLQLFVEAGAPMPALLAQRSQDGPLGAFATRLLAAFAHDGPETEPLEHPRVFDTDLDLVAQPYHSTSAEQLSEREQEVLQLIAQGLSNQEIAARLVISVPTVKKHGSNIFAKLNVTNRTEAVVRARERGLLVLVP